MENNELEHQIIDRLNNNKLAVYANTVNSTFTSLLANIIDLSNVDTSNGTDKLQQMIALKNQLFGDLTRKIVDRYPYPASNVDGLSNEIGLLLRHVVELVDADGARKASEIKVIYDGYANETDPGVKSNILQNLMDRLDKLSPTLNYNNEVVAGAAHNLEAWANALADSMFDGVNKSFSHLLNEGKEEQKNVIALCKDMYDIKQVDIKTKTATEALQFSKEEQRDRFLFEKPDLDLGIEKVKVDIAPANKDILIACSDAEMALVFENFCNRLVTDTNALYNDNPRSNYLIINVLDNLVNSTTEEFLKSVLIASVKDKAGVLESLRDKAPFEHLQTLKNDGVLNSSLLLINISSQENLLNGESNNIIASKIGTFISNVSTNTLISQKILNIIDITRSKLSATNEFIKLIRPNLYKGDYKETSSENMGYSVNDKDDDFIKHNTFSIGNTESVSTTNTIDSEDEDDFFGKIDNASSEAVEEAPTIDQTPDGKTNVNTDSKPKELKFDDKFDSFLKSLGLDMSKFITQTSEFNSTKFSDALIKDIYSVKSCEDYRHKFEGTILNINGMIRGETSEKLKSLAEEKYIDLKDRVYDQIRRCFDKVSVQIETLEKLNIYGNRPINLEGYSDVYKKMWVHVIENINGVESLRLITEQDKMIAESVRLIFATVAEEHKYNYAIENDIHLNNPSLLKKLVSGKESVYIQYHASLDKLKAMDESIHKEFTKYAHDIQRHVKVLKDVHHIGNAMYSSEFDNMVSESIEQHKNATINRIIDLSDSNKKKLYDKIAENKYVKDNNVTVEHVLGVFESTNDVKPFYKSYINRIAYGAKEKTEEFNSDQLELVTKYILAGKSIGVLSTGDVNEIEKVFGFNEIKV